ncbi:retrovirus-related pol polyprotein from transposon TNT 1-94 [Tanacetum coccineum]
MSASPVCLLTKASSTKSWLWHRRLNHLNFGTLNELARKNLVRGLPMLKYAKDHLCPSCQLGKSKKASHPLKAENTNTEVLNTLHMDLCGPMRTESINGKKYILVIVDDYTRFGWVRFLRSKDETPQVIEKFIVKTQRALNATVRFVRTDNGTEFVNKTLDGWFESVGIRGTSLSRAGKPVKKVLFLRGAPAVTESLLPHQIPLPDTSDSDDETLFDHVDNADYAACQDTRRVLSGFTQCSWTSVLLVNPKAESTPSSTKEANTTPYPMLVLKSSGCDLNSETNDCGQTISDVL